MRTAQCHVRYEWASAQFQSQYAVPFRCQCDECAPCECASAQHIQLRESGGTSLALWDDSAARPSRARPARRAADRRATRHRARRRSSSEEAPTPVECCRGATRSSGRSPPGWLTQWRSNVSSSEAWITARMVVSAATWRASIRRGRSARAADDTGTAKAQKNLLDIIRGQLLSRGDVAPVTGPSLARFAR